MSSQTVIFGGTFNPVHVGHLIVARSVAERLAADKVILMPTANPPHKDVPLADAAHRLEMLRLATAGDDLFEVSTLETDRAGVSYTYQTLRELRRTVGEDVSLIWVIGMDMLLDLACWRRLEEVLSLARLVTVARPPMPADLADRLAPLRERLGEEQVAQLIADVMCTPLIEVSSTEIRQRVAAGQAVDYLTPKSVVDYIRTHRLYAKAD